MKKVNILGIEITDYSLKEALKLSSKYLNGGALNTVSYISTQLLVEAGDNKEQKEWIESMDMTVCGEVDILRAIDVTARNRIKEVANNEYFKELLHRYIRNKKTIFLVADSEDNLKNLREYIQWNQGNAVIIGSYVLNEETGTEDNLVNEINDVVPHVIISKVAHPAQERLMFQNKMKINANLWVALPESLPLKDGHKKIEQIILWLYKRIFNRRVSKYKNG